MAEWKKAALGCQETMEIGPFTLVVGDAPYRTGYYFKLCRLQRYGFTSVEAAKEAAVEAARRELQRALEDVCC